MNNVDLSTLPDLDQCVIDALELLGNPKTGLPEIDFRRFKRPLVVGSGNAAATGKIMFADLDAVFADESTYESRLHAVPNIDGVVIVSASGGKHAPIIAKFLHDRGKHIPLLLLTCNENAEARKDVDETIVFPWNPEPYTYNTSTYMGMILTKTQEDPKAILQHIRHVVDPALHEFGAHFASFDAYFVLVPEELDLIRPMLSTKFVELFGRQVARDVYTKAQAMHATTLVPCDTELFLSFGEENQWWGAPQRRLHIPLPSEAGYAAMMAAGYYVIGKIQAQKFPFFKTNAAAYCRDAKQWFGKELSVVVKYR
ncbi:MAG: hypothetical protein JW955_20150 [Sedimentisphaerales bacterium]|nr:hypothetical protein [Sedimentisphaerales bacterium]